MGRTKDIDARTDVWAVGSLMFALLTGRPVHVGEDLHQQLLLAGTRPAPALDTIVPHAEAHAVVIVARALALERDDRYQSAREMQAAVAVARAELSSMAAVMTTHEYPAAAASGPATSKTLAADSTASVPGPRTRRAAIVVIAAVAVASALSISVRVARRGGAGPSTTDSVSSRAQGVVAPATDHATPDLAPSTTPSDHAAANSAPSSSSDRPTAEPPRPPAGAAAAPSVRARPVPAAHPSAPHAAPPARAGTDAGNWLDQR